jgi:hypothetical protein
MATENMSYASQRSVLSVGPACCSHRVRSPVLLAAGSDVAKRVPVYLAPGYTRK